MTTIGVDLGGTKILAAVVKDGKAGKPIKQPTPTGGPSAVVEAVVHAVHELGGADRVGLGTPGVVDHDDGHGQPCAEPRGLGQAGRAARPAREGAAGHRGARRQRRERRCPRRAVSGCGSRATRRARGLRRHRGRRRVGPRRTRSGAGHAASPARSVTSSSCPMGVAADAAGLGHLEAYAGRAGIEAEARRRADAGVSTVLIELAGDGQDEVRRHRQGPRRRGPRRARADRRTRSSRSGRRSPRPAPWSTSRRVVLGGGITEKLGAEFVARVDAAVQARVIAGLPVEVVAAALGDDAGVVGAASLFD